MGKIGVSVFSSKGSSFVGSFKHVEVKVQVPQGMEWATALVHLWADRSKGAPADGHRSIDDNYQLLVILRATVVQFNTEQMFQL